MKHIKSLIAAALVVSFGTAALAEDTETKVIGVSIPAATHGWAGGMNFHAQEAVKRLEEVYPQLDFVLSTASDPGTQVNDIEDMVAVRGIDALVVLPFESDPLTPPVQAVLMVKTMFLNGSGNTRKSIQNHVFYWSALAGRV